MIQTGFIEPVIRVSEPEQPGACRYLAGNNENEKGICKETGRILIEVDPNYYRPAEVETLLGDPSKAKNQLGWNPTRTSFEELVKIMVQHDLDYVKRN